jgi:alpha-beta hydrolase superfamily lysophospholipase
LAKFGYELAGVDQRGFGDSEGMEGKIESFEINSEDNYIFHERYVEHYSYLKGVPKFIISGSFGGQLALYCHLARPKFYSGLCLGAPYFRHRDEDGHRKIMPLVHLIASCSNRHYRMNFGYDTRQKAHVEHWDLDPKHLGMSISMHTLIEFVRSLDNINNNNLFTKVNIPLLVQTAGEDLVVDNFKMRHYLS